MWADRFWRRLCLIFLRSFLILSVKTILLHMMTLTTSHSLDSVNLRNHLIAFAYAPWIDSRYLLDNNIIIPYVCGDHLRHDVSLFELDCDDFRSHMCVLVSELDNPKFDHRSARERFAHVCWGHWSMSGGHVLLPGASWFDLLFAWSSNEYRFCRRMALEL